MKTLFMTLLLANWFTTSLIAQDLPCQEKYENQRCAVRYKEDSQGNIHGQYIEYTEDGTVFRKGNYDHGVKIGCWYDGSDGAILFFGGPYQWYENGQSIAGSFKEITSIEQANQIKAQLDKASIKVKTFEENGQMYKWEYKEDKWGYPVGVSKIYYPSGKLRKVSNYGSYNGKGLNGKENGPYTFYYENGKIAETGQYFNSNTTGIIESFFDNGKLKSRSYYEQDQSDLSKWNREGIQVEYYHNGNIKERKNYKRDKLNGVCESYYDNGVLKSRLNFKEDIKTGSCEWFNSNGKLETKQFYTNLTDLGICTKLYDKYPCYKITCEDYNDNNKLIFKSSTIYHYNGEDFDEICRDGAFEWYNDNGMLETKYNYSNGLKDGEFIRITPTNKYTGTYSNGKLISGNDTISLSQYVKQFMEKNQIVGIDKSLSDTIILSVNFNAGNPAGIQKIYQKGSNKILLQIFYNEQGKLTKIERYFKNFAEEEDKIQYQNCMITLTNQCQITPSEKPYSTGYAADGKIVFNYFLQGPYTGKLDYPDPVTFVSKMKEIIVRNEKGELEAYINHLNQEVGNKEIIKIMLNDLIPAFEAEKMQHKDFKVIKSLYLN